MPSNWWKLQNWDIFTGCWFLCSKSCPRELFSHDINNFVTAKNLKNTCMYHLSDHWGSHLSELVVDMSWQFMIRHDISWLMTWFCYEKSSNIIKCYKISYVMKISLKCHQVKSPIITKNLSVYHGGIWWHIIMLANQFTEQSRAPINNGFN